jgi:prepilin-type N-terminal cleavage/methylation domain-containing protein
MKRKGFTLIELLVVIAIIALLMSILMPALARVKELANRVVCGTNCSGIVKSMMVYANDDESGRMPRAGYSGGGWGAPGDMAWSADVTTTPPGDPFPKDTATITASLYLLVKYDFTTPRQFMCKSDVGTEEFKEAPPEAFWDFGGNPGKACSYSYHMPYSCDTSTLGLGLTSATEPSMAVVADRNPYGDDTYGGNCIAHQGDGQNVAFLDTHVKFHPTPAVALNDDNIYTYQDGPDIGAGAIPEVGDGPDNREDSLLVSEIPIP